MPRIRTIKPEFPQSESMGRVSREARLCFLLLFTLVDDEGRARGSSRMLASLLYPYDADAGDLISGWLAELEREECIRLYNVGGNAYVQVVKWKQHQNIDKPSRSKIPPFDESSRVLANALEASSLDQRIKGSEDQRIMDQGGECRGEDEATPVAPNGSPTGSPDELDLGEVNGHKLKTKKPDKPDKPDKHGTRLPADWQPSEASNRFAIEHGLDPNRVLAEFRDHWIAVPGWKGRKLNWDATFRNRVRQLADRKPPQPEHRVIL